MTGVNEVPAPRDVDFQTLGPGLSSFDRLDPFIAVDLRDLTCEQAAESLAKHFLDNRDRLYDMNAPIENLAGYYLEGDRYTVARVGRERPFGVPMLLSAYGQTLRYEDLIQGEGTAGTWCDDSTIEASFRQALEATRPELLVVPEGSTGLDVADIAELVAILATDEF